MSNPGSIAYRSDKLRNSKPAPTSKTSARDTSAMTSVRRIHWWPPAVRRELCCSFLFRSLREAYSAGSNPTPRPISVVIPSAKANTVPSTPISAIRGSSMGLRATNARTPNWATSSPSAPPIIASNRLSVSSCRIIRLRSAPRAIRIANSPRLFAPRASSRLVTFTQAIRSSRTTAPRTAINAGFTPLVT